MPDRPNVLFLLSDQHSFRHLGYRDDDHGEPVRTPTLDGLAENGAAFDAAYCPMPLCTPSRHCLLKGREVRNAGAWANGQMVTPGQDTMPGTFSDAGYETCLVGKMHLGGDRQFVGFDHRPYGDLLGLNGHQYEPVSPERRSGDGWSDADSGVTEYPESQLQEQVVARETMAWLREHEAANPDQPWFLCASFSRPHTPLTTPPRHFDRYEGEVPPPKTGLDTDAAAHPMAQANGAGEYGEVDEKARAAYFGCVDYLDEILGDLLAMLDRAGFLENTIVVYTSDHGENCGEHGLWGKGTWHEGSARVPMLVQTPEHRRGEVDSSRIETPTNIIDLYPTLCGLADVEVPDDLDGADLSTAVRGGSEPDRGPVFCDNFLPWLTEGMHYRAVRDGRYKYVRSQDAPELFFDLAEDPFETTNLADDPGEHADALERLRGIVDDTLDFAEMERERESDLSDLRNPEMGVPKGTAGNAYLLRDGRVVDADVVMTKPDEQIRRPEKVFVDWPEDEA
jgi:choline-sulfatase